MDVHNNNRDGAGQMFIPLNPNAYNPNTLNSASPKQANQSVGNGFFTAPDRKAGGNLVRARSSTFEDVWSQPRLFFNSLVPAEQQFVVNAMRFENSNVKSDVVRNNVIIQLNRISNDLARRVASAIGVDAPEPDQTYYHDNTTADVGAFGHRLQRLAGLKVGVLASVNAEASFSAATAMSSELSSNGIDVVVVGERMAQGVNQTYSASDAIQFDAVVVAPGTENLFGAKSATKSTPTFYPAGRPLEILVDAFRFGKPVAALGSGSTALDNAGINQEDNGVYVAESVTQNFANHVKEGLTVFKFLERFALDSDE